jgi:hypothetical protein
MQQRAFIRQKKQQERIAQYKEMKLQQQIEAIER